jgi:hypothetical protein
MLARIERRPRTLGELVYHGSREYRRLRRLELDELLRGGYVVRDRFGWYRSTGQVSK